MKRDHPREMRQWEIVMLPFSREKRHPAVIISNDEICQNPDIEDVNALICTSARLNRVPKLNEEALDESDGLDWKTAVRCDRIYLLPKAQFDDRKGNVTHERRRRIGRKMVEMFRLPLA